MNEGHKIHTASMYYFDTIPSICHMLLIFLKKVSVEIVQKFIMRDKVIGFVFFEIDQ